MTRSLLSQEELISTRLYHQQIAKPKFTKVDHVVHWMGAMQAQEFAMVKWAIGLRSKDIVHTDVEEAFNNGKIIRTHLMRPTWHFVSPKDLRWLLMLTAPRVHAINGTYYRKLELTPPLLNKFADVLISLLQGKNFLTRDEIKAAFEKRKMNADGLRIGYILMFAELEGIICSGPRKGKNFTYALLEERVKPCKQFLRDEALVELAARFFTSRGVATAHDFSNWSGLTIADCKTAIENIKTEFDLIQIDGKDHLVNQVTTASGIKTFLMPQYDEYGMSYKKWGALQHSSFTISSKVAGKTVFNHLLIVKGKARGVWQRIVLKEKPNVSVKIFDRATRVEKQDVDLAIKRYHDFFGANEA